MIAATRCLKAARFVVAIPSRSVGCGLPLYDWGMLDTTKGLWRQTMHTLREDVETGVPLVGLEPACVAAFKDELVNLLRDHPLARKLSEGTHYFSDFVAQHLPEDLPTSDTSAIVHVHCNHHAVIGKAGGRALLSKAGIQHQVLPSGCFGMAGPFGFGAGKYNISMRLAERVLLPAVRDAVPGKMVVASGFSCREQIEQGTGCRTLHAAGREAGPGRRRLGGGARGGPALRDRRDHGRERADPPTSYLKALAKGDPNAAAVAWHSFKRSIFS